jgi:hypothetical protein
MYPVLVPCMEWVMKCHSKVLQECPWSSICNVNLTRIFWVVNFKVTRFRRRELDMYLLCKMCF